MLDPLSRFSKPLEQRLPDEFAILECTCFSDLYRMAPRDNEAFHAMFRRDCEVLALRRDDTLAGMAFVEHAGETVMYLRVICVHPQHRGRGLGLELMQGVHDTLRCTRHRYLAFTSEDARVVALARSAGLEVVHIAEEAVREQIEAYNPRIHGRHPGDVLEGYYERPNGSPVDATFYLMRSPSCE